MDLETERIVEGSRKSSDLVQQPRSIVAPREYAHGKAYPRIVCARDVAAGGGACCRWRT